MKNKRNFTVKILYFINNKVKIDEIEICEGTKAIDIIASFQRDIFEKIKKRIDEDFEYIYFFLSFRVVLL